MKGVKNVRGGYNPSYFAALIALTGIQSPYCREQNIVASKIGAQIVVRSILGLPIDIDAIPEGETEIVDSIVEAEPVRAAEGVELELYVNGPY